MPAGEVADPGPTGRPAPVGEIAKPAVRFPGGRRYVSTTAGEVLVDVLGPADRPAPPSAWYGVRLRDVQGRPLRAERVAITWRTETGTLIEVPFDRSAESGLYAGHVTLPRDAVTDFRLHVTMRDRRFAVPLNAGVLGARLEQ
jgi:hypothetical protein